MSMPEAMALRLGSRPLRAAPRRRVADDDGRAVAAQVAPLDVLGEALVEPGGELVVGAAAELVHGGVDVLVHQRGLGLLGELGARR